MPGDGEGLYGEGAEAHEVLDVYIGRGDGGGDGGTDVEREGVGELIVEAGEGLAVRVVVGKLVVGTEGAEDVVAVEGSGRYVTVGDGDVVPVRVEAEAGRQKKMMAAKARRRVRME